MTDVGMGLSSNMRRIGWTSAVVTALLVAGCGVDPQKSLATARERAAQGDSAGAIIEVKNALQAAPELAEARFLFGSMLLDQGDSAGASKELRKAMQLGWPIEQVVPLLSRTVAFESELPRWEAELSALKPATPAAKAVVTMARAEAAFEAGRGAEAKTLLAAAVAGGANPAQAGTLEARILAAEGDMAGALAGASRVIQGHPAYADARLLRGAILVVQGKPDAALADYAAASKAHPRLTTPRLRSIRLLMQLGRFDDAKKALAELNKLSPGNAQARFLEGLLAFHRGEFQAARDAADSVLRVAPDFLPGLALAGMARVQLKDHIQAQSHLEKAVAKAPGAAGSRLVLARSYLATQDPKRALAVLEPLLSQGKADREVYSVGGQAAFLLGDTARARSYFEQAAQLAPDDVRAQTRLAVAKLATGDADQAIRDLEAAARKPEQESSADVTLILALLQRGEVAKALAAAEAFVKKRPDRAVPYAMLGGAREAAKDVPGAREAYARALAVDAKYTPALHNLARLDLVDKNAPQARKRYEDWLAKHPDATGEIVVPLAQIMAAQNAPAGDIRRLLENGVSKAPQEPKVRSALIEWLARTGDLKAARTASDEFVAAFPAHGGAWASAGRLRLQTGDVSQAVTAFEKLVQLEPNGLVGLVALAEAHEAAKNPDGARQALQRALTVRPDALEVQRRLIGLLVTQKQSEEALRVVMQVREQRPKAAVSHALESDVMAAQGRWPEALAAAQKAMALEKSGAAAVKYHNAASKAGKTAEAERFAADWLKNNPKDPVFRAYAAEQAMNAKDYAGAARQYREVVALDPKNAVALNNLAWVSMQTKDPKALGYIDQALAVAPDLPALLDTKAAILSSLGRDAEALVLLKKAAGAMRVPSEINLNLARALIKQGDKAAARTELDKLTQGLPDASPLKREAQSVLQTL